MNEKLKSRKFIFTVVWNVFVIVGLVSTIIIKKDIAYVGSIITFAGAITAAYIGMQGYADIKK